MIVKRYSEDPNKYWPMIERFRLQTFKEGNDSLTYKKYNPDNPEIETFSLLLKKLYLQTFDNNKNVTNYD